MSAPLSNIDNRWYCVDCVFNNECINCSVMDTIVEMRIKLLTSLDDKKSNVIEFRKKYCWECWNEIFWKYRLCGQCYLKFKQNWDLY